MKAIDTHDKRLCAVGFDTSNYTTSVAVCDISGNVILNLKLPLPVKEGDRGLRQSDAVYAHIKNLPQLTATLSAFFAEKELTPVAVAYSASPTTDVNSFMPCFQCGKAFALSFASALAVPVYPYTHQEGHIAAAVYSACGNLSLLDRELLAFHVSGGTTDILLCSPNNHRTDIKRIGGSSDLHAGQLIDRIGVMMKMPFPCGVHVERSANAYKEDIKGIKTSVNGLVCNLSGGENAALKIYKDYGENACSKFTLSFIAKTLDKLSDNLRTLFPGYPIVYSGGVMSNKYISGILAKRNNTFFAEPAFSADNAAGIALLACKRFNSTFEVLK